MDWLLIIAALFLAFNNGANDNFKGFATVWGSDTLSYRQALILATLATLAGSAASLMLADHLIQQFSGRGLVPTTIANSPAFITSVACGAAMTVFMATRFGFPISTTHALIGGLVGAGLGFVGTVNYNTLVQSFFVPMLLSPVVAASLAWLIYKTVGTRKMKADCLCVVESTTHTVAPAALSATRGRVLMPSVVISDQAQCDAASVLAKTTVHSRLEKIHIGSAVTICFARALNDTPKLAALLFAAQFTQQKMPITLVAVSMAVGGLLFARNVAITMSKKVTKLDDSQGLSANLVTACVVLLASKFGLPVSTTHVSVGSIAGVGASAGTLNVQALRGVLLSWVATLPFAMAIAWLVSLFL